MQILRLGSVLTLPKMQWPSGSLLFTVEACIVWPCWMTKPSLNLTRYAMDVMHHETDIEVLQQRLLLGWVTPMGWYRVRLATNSQFWETVHGLACAKVVVAQSTELVRSQIYVLEECLCGLTENALLTATDNNSRQVLPVVALSAILLGIVTVVYAREWMHVFM